MSGIRKRRKLDSLRYSCRSTARHPDSFGMALHRGLLNLRVEERGLRFDRLAVVARLVLHLFSGGFDRLDLCLPEPFEALRASVRVEHVIKHQPRIVVEAPPIQVVFFESGLRV